MQAVTLTEVQLRQLIAEMMAAQRQGRPARFIPPTPFPLSTTSGQTLGENRVRQFLLLQNLYSVNVLYQFDRDAAPDDALRLQPGGLIGWDIIVPTNAIYCRLETSTGTPGKLMVSEA